MNTKNIDRFIAQTNKQIIDTKIDHLARVQVGIPEFEKNLVRFQATLAKLQDELAEIKRNH